MKKIAEIIEKHNNVCTFIYMMLALIGYIYAVPLYVGDEFWNFSFIYKMANGYEIYKDLNVITTPLFHYIGTIILRILGDNYISFRIYNILIFSTLFTLIYILFQKLKIEKISAFFYTLIISIFFLHKGYIAIGASYNFLALIFVIIGLYIELNKDKNINNIFKGLNLFCIFMTKQNIFILFVISLFILYIIKIKQKEINIKQAIKNILLIAISFIIPFIIFVIYLYINQTLYDFLSYCLFGTKEFGNSNKLITTSSIQYILISLVEIIISSILINLKKANKEIRNNNLKLISPQIIMLFWAYPILDSYHMMCGAFISILMLIYNLHNIFIIEFINKKTLNKIIKLCVAIITIYFILYNLYYFWKYKNSDIINNDINPYVNIMINKELKENIITICNYIKENEEIEIETKIISPNANLYLNVLQKNNKNMDLPLLGNFGKDGEEGMIKQVENLKEGTKILITKEMICWQESEKLRDAIINACKKIGEIENFYIYEK